MSKQDGYLLIILALFVIAYIQKPVPEPATLNVTVEPRKYKIDW